MGCGALVVRTAGAGLCGAITLGVLGAGYGAANGAIGAAILDASGHDGYNVLEAVQMGSLGSVIIDTAVGCCMGMMGSCAWSFLKIWLDDGSDENSDYNTNAFLCNLIFYVGTNVIAGLIGFAILNAGSEERVMGLAQTAASLAIGSAITFCPQYLISLCITVPLAVFFTAALALEDDDCAEHDRVNDAERGRRLNFFPAQTSKPENTAYVEEIDSEDSSEDSSSYSV